jgi:myxalamid-type polyketide synthase MxaB
LTFAAAATLPTAFLTAHYALNQLAQLQAGERVLIHAAAGGVGQAAIQLAQRIGAEIFATASPSKWEWLRSQGIQHLYSSRDPDFVAAVMATTQGEEIDVVLNSLTGQFIDHSFAVLRSAGRFVEIGKTEVWDPQDVARVRPDVAYFLIDLIQITQDHPHRIQAMLHDLFNQFEQGQLQPLPQTIFPAEQATEAFRYMQQAKQIGKIILTQEPPHPLIHSTGRYLITGGWGSLGLLVARWLVERGATQLILVGRHAPSPVAKAAIAALQQTGTTITLIQADIADPIAVHQTLSPYLPFQGIFHAAGAIDDGILQQQTWERFETVMTAKVEGAWNLHCLTQDYPIDCFVLFSSAAALIGSAGQANYAAANAFLDGLAHFRRSIGLPGLSVNWGAWSQVGMAARLKQARRQAEPPSNRSSTIAPDRGIAVLEALLRAAQTNPVAQVGVLLIDWSSWTGPVTPFLSQVVSQNTSKSVTNIVPQPSLGQRLKTASAVDYRAQLLTDLTAQVAKILGLNAATIDPTQGLSELGLDSLTTVELRNWLQTELGCRLPATLLFDYPTIAALTDYLVQTIAPSPAEQLILAPSATEALQSDIQQLSEAEAEELLLAELDRLEH